MTTEQLLDAALAFEGVTIGLAILAIIGHARGVANGDRTLAQRMHTGRALLLASLEGPIDDELVGRVRRLGRRTQIRLLAEIAPSLEGAERAKLRELATRLGIVARAERQCRSRWWWRRLYATRVLTLADAGDDVMPGLIGDPHQLVRTQVAEWAALHPAPSMLLALVALLDDQKLIARFAVQDTLLRIGRPAVPAIMSSIGTMSPRGIASGLAVAARLGDAEMLPLGLSFSDHPEPPVRAGAADVLGAIGGDEAVDGLLGLLADPAIEVRRSAARGLGRLEHWASAAALRPLLGDPAWLVRRESALALTAMGAPGSLILRTALRSSDRFAADIAAQALGLRTERA